MPNPAYNLDQSSLLRIGVHDDLEMSALPSESQVKEVLPTEATYDFPTSRLSSDMCGDLEHTYEAVNVA